VSLGGIQHRCILHGHPIIWWAGLCVGLLSHCKNSRFEDCHAALYLPGVLSEMVVLQSSLL
jgi:hypothetical protein